MGNNPSLSGPLPVNVGGLIHLVYLDLHGAGLVGFIPPTIGNLASLAFLRLDSNQLYGTYSLEQLYPVGVYHKPTHCCAMQDPFRRNCLR